MQAAEEYPTLLEVIDVILDVLPHGLQRVAVDDGDVEDDLVLLQLEVVAELFDVLLVLVEPAVDAEELVVLLVVLAHEEGVHYVDPGQLVEVAQVHQHVHEGAHADVVLWVADAGHDLLGQLAELGEDALVLLEHVADVVHLREEDYLFVEVEVVLILPIAETAHELHVGQLVDAVAVPAVPALEVRHVVVVLRRAGQHPIAVFRPALLLQILGGRRAAIAGLGEGLRTPDGEAASGIIIAIGGNSFYNVATKDE